MHVIGTKVGSLYDTTKALEFAAQVRSHSRTHGPYLTTFQGKLKPIYEVFPVAKMPAAVAKLRGGKVAGRLVVDFNA